MAIHPSLSASGRHHTTAGSTFQSAGYEAKNTEPTATSFPAPADDFVEDPINLNELLIQHPTATFFVRVASKAMLNVGIAPGDTLVVDRSLSPHDRDVVVAILDHAFIVRRLRQLPDGQTLLAPENPHFKPIPITEGTHCEIWGKVTHSIHKL